MANSYWVKRACLRMTILNKYFMDDPPTNKFWYGLIAQIRVIRALMIRHALSRFGHENIGFFWVIGEPMLLTCGVMIMWKISGQTHGSEVGVIPFALTGYSYITLWRHIVFFSVKCMTYNASLAFHQNISFIDVLLSRALLETVSVFSAFFICYIPLSLLDYAPPIHDPLLLVGGLGLCGWFSFSFGLILAAVSELSEPVEKFIQPIMYLTIPITGVFFMLDWLPPQAQEVLSWSPLVHGIEMFRGGLFPPDIPTYWDPIYLIAWCVIMTGIGLPLFQYAQRHVHLL